MSDDRNSRVREHEAELRIAQRDEAADGVVALTLASTDGELPEWRPGAHIDLMLNGSLVRQYSLCSSPQDRSAWRIGVLRDPASRGGSRFVHDELEDGSMVRYAGPRNHFPLVAARALPVHRRRHRHHADPPDDRGGRGVAARTGSCSTADANATRWRSSTSSSGYGDRVQLWPQDEPGLLDLDPVLGTPRDDTLVYCCGPEALLDAVEEKCAAWPKGSLHIERFAAKNAGGGCYAGRSTAFEVVCQRSGVTVEVPRRQVDLRRRRGGRRRRARLMHGGRLRHLRDAPSSRAIPTIATRC